MIVQKEKLKEKRKKERKRLTKKACLYRRGKASVT